MFTKNVIILFVECTDDEADCSKWAEVGECQKNPTFMLKSCKKSCDQCGNQIISLFCTISLHTYNIKFEYESMGSTPLNIGVLDLQ